jgi:hypothetical protein
MCGVPRVLLLVDKDCDHIEQCWARATPGAPPFPAHPHAPAPGVRHGVRAAVFVCPLNESEYIRAVQGHLFMMKKMICFITDEITIWVMGLMGLFFFGHNNEAPSLCIFHSLGISGCLGCGLGHAVHDAMHFRFPHSIDHHLLGIPVLCVLLYRIVTQTASRIKQTNTWINSN